MPSIGFLSKVYVLTPDNGVLYIIHRARAKQMVRDEIATRVDRRCVRLKCAAGIYGKDPDRPTTTSHHGYSHQNVVRSNDIQLQKYWEFQRLPKSDRWAFVLSQTDCMK